MTYPLALAAFGASLLLVVPPFLPLLEAAEVPLRNPRFEVWGADGKPIDWAVGATSDYRVSRDCGAASPGRCVMRVEGAPGESAKFVSVGQEKGVAEVGGHLAKLSGMIRTDKVEDGWAGLWLRVDGHGRMLRLENMFKFGPRGTNDWKRFEIALPVPPNARRIVYGTILAGSGTAWFDDLRLEVDRSVKVEAHPDAELAIPPRPRASAALLGDDELALPEADIPPVDAARREQARARHHAIRSLFSEDFSDLAFLEPLLEGKRVVQLGESGHGVAEFNWLKVRLIKFLHRSLGFDVVAFESSLSGCALADARIGAAAPIEVMRDCIFGVWHTAETLPLFEYLDAERKAGRRIALAGFDTQNSGLAAKAVGTRLAELARKVDPGLAAAIRAHEARGYSLAPAEAEAMAKDYLALAEALGASRKRLLEAYAERPADIALAVQEARSRARYARQRTSAEIEARERTRIRDEGMADNLDFVLDTLYPGRKVIVWAHNSHIARYPHDSDQPYAMGHFVALRRGPETYTIGLYMGRGVASTNGRERYAIQPPPRETLEAVLASAGRRMSFVETRGWTAPELVREWGTVPRRIVPARAYDAVIYIDTVTPPEYR